MTPVLTLNFVVPVPKLRHGSCEENVDRYSHELSFENLCFPMSCPRSTVPLGKLIAIRYLLLVICW